MRERIVLPSRFAEGKGRRTFFCGCRSVCKEFLIVRTCDRVRTFVRPVGAADKAPLAGMVMRGPGPNLQQRARGSEKVSGFPDPDHVDHVPIQIMSSSQLGGRVTVRRRIRCRLVLDRDNFRPASASPRCPAPSCWQARLPLPGPACAPASAPATTPSAPPGARPSGSRRSPR